MALDLRAEPTMPQIGIIITYFGKLPPYFELFVHSCRYNKEIDWHIYTDQTAGASLPPNVIFHPMTFSELVGRIQEKLQCPVSIFTPYKLCDFRLAYGVIFADVLRPYGYWGFGDIDVIMGNVTRVIDREIFTKFKKIYTQGHFSLFKNCDEMNHLFMADIPGQYYKDIFVDPVNRIFDESKAIRQRLRHCHIPYYIDHFVADIMSTRSDYTLSDEFFNYNPQIFIWENGSIYRLWLNQGQIIYDEFSYIHLQKRRLPAPEFVVNEQLNRFVISPTGFYAIPEGIPSSATWGTLNSRSRLQEFRQLLLRPWKRLKRAIGEKRLSR